ncbi:energy-coupling factor ABC transporter ATP-binding protein [uncultured Cedecea sp.]|uniref:energy-coupling factor ABC transporter ATP-binding protein n=1 Tax=uncultured Cedecea sp. TaxID=988762 RepID=UPI0026375AA9|nr:ABC transporter ATP-binding protein [uncultured Cedecea sp.]
MFEFTEVSVKKDQRFLLQNISTKIDEKRVGIIGLNGSGKSTFAKLLNGLEIPTSGNIHFNGQPDVKARRREVGFVFQNPDNQIVYPVVEEDLRFGLKNLRLSQTEMNQRLDEVVTRFKLGPLLNRFAHQLSGGERQMVALAGVLVMKPRVIVFDEPTTLLDLKNKRMLIDAINSLSQQVVMITHDLELLRQFNRVIHIAGGGIKNDGSPDSVLDSYIEEYA